MKSGSENGDKAKAGATGSEDRDELDDAVDQLLDISMAKSQNEEDDQSKSAVFCEKENI